MNFEYKLLHVGINTENEQEAKEMAEKLSFIFNLDTKMGNKSIFAGSYFECMKAPFLGKNGHIAMGVENLKEAMEELSKKGLSFNMDTAAFDEKGQIKNIYLDGEFAGFAIHIMETGK